MSSSPSGYWVVGTDPTLIHLLRRFAEQHGNALREQTGAPDVAAVRQAQPAALIFLSIEHLQAAQGLVDGLAAHETPILVCASVADEARARELGADACLLHPLTYAQFLTVLEAVRPPQPS